MALEAGGLVLLVCHDVWVNITSKVHLHYVSGYDLHEGMFIWLK
jgi:hypothetical protein